MKFRRLYIDLILVVFCGAFACVPRGRGQLISDARADAICEAAPLSFSELELMLKSNQSLIINPVTTSRKGWWIFGKTVTRIGHNIIVSGCQRYGTKGLPELANDIDAALSHGARCLANLDKWQPTQSSIRTIEYLKAHSPNSSLIEQLKSNIVQLLGFFNNTSKHPLNLACTNLENDGHMKPDAVSAACGEGGTEAIMELDLSTFHNKSADFRQGTIFHEFFHLLRVHHPPKLDQFDMIRAIETCCFAPNWARDMADQSCADLITRHHGDHL